jgi:pimeloyl-ACP methyl ester carboxylesterase
MLQRKVLYLHGFGSSGKTSKAQLLKSRLEGMPGVNYNAFEFTPTPLDFQYLTITGMVNRLRHELAHSSFDKLVLVGSSLGALVALNYAHFYGGVDYMLLLAPATQFDSARGEKHIEKVFHYAFNRELPLDGYFYQDGKYYEFPVPPAAPTVIIHGRNDNVIPVSGSHAYFKQYQDMVTLHEVESDHRLLDQIEFIWDTLAGILDEVGPRPVDFTQEY